MFVAVNRKNVITAVSEQPFSITGYNVVQLPDVQPKSEWGKLVGTKLKTDLKKTEQLKIAFICNWNDQCGISTYSKFLVEAIITKVKDVRVFSEKGSPYLIDPPKDEPFVQRCWSRGESMKPCIDAILAWEPDLILIQHEFGIFPKATYFLQLLQGIEDIPYAVTTHSIYEHRDKSL
jgi:hypothetical protein